MDSWWHRRLSIGGKVYDVDILPLADPASSYQVRVNGKDFTIDRIEKDLPVEEETVRHPVPSGTLPGKLESAVRIAPERNITDGNVHEVRAPLPGKIGKIEVEPGMQVKHGQVILSLEAMKMKNVIRAPREGTLTHIHVKENQMVAFGEPLFVIE